MGLTINLGDTCQFTYKERNEGALPNSIQTKKEVTK